MYIRQCLTLEMFCFGNVLLWHCFALALLCFDNVSQRQCFALAMFCFGNVLLWQCFALAMFCLGNVLLLQFFWYTLSNWVGMKFHTINNSYLFKKLVVILFIFQKNILKVILITTNTPLINTFFTNSKLNYLQGATVISRILLTSRI